MLKKTKICCTIGPASAQTETLAAMMKAGMNVARLNFSHGNYADFTRLVKNLRQTASRLGHPLAILQDLQGPKIRIGALPKDGLMLTVGQKIVLNAKTVKGSEVTAANIPIQYKNLPHDVRAGDLILINDGLIEIRVTDKTASTINCSVEAGGLLTGNKGINVPGGTIGAAAITAKDKRDLAFGLKLGVDFIALSFVKDAADLRTLRRLLGKTKNPPLLIAKIERREAIENLEAIVQAADGLMVARGDLGLEVPAAQVPFLQKKIIALANRHAKPVITATQMLDSMVDNPRATRAEISDIATAILDKTDAVMLSNESAVGAYPVRATQTLAAVALEAEKMLKKIVNEQESHVSRQDLSLLDATCLSATSIAQNIRARFLIAVTNRGYTARELAKHRVSIPIIAITPFESTKRQLQLVWGVTRCLVGKINRRNLSDQVLRLLRAENLIAAGDEIVICSAKGANQDLILTIKI